MLGTDKHDALKRIKMLEPYISEEIDKNNHLGFLSICRGVGVSEVQSAVLDSELAGVFCTLQEKLSELGMDVPCDFGTLQKECAEREHWEEVERENDRMEIEFSRSKEQMARLYIKQAQLEEAVGEKERLERHVGVLRGKEALSQVSEEVLGLADLLQVGTEEQGGEESVVSPAEDSEGFHSVFLPFVDLSFEAVNFLYNQIRFADEGACKQAQETEKKRAYKDVFVQKYIKYVKDQQVLACAIEKEPCRKKKLGCQIIQAMLSTPALCISDLCKILGVSREEAMERVFFLSAKGVLLFNRLEDTVALASTN
ncbi:hypothetical protein NECID01_1180 [Nematocida sp. AWRm77]|nr:hypothetical protein NECID01_1180 [Nematocida sp. AWRm77]